jgi:hypothetical protein
MASKRVFEKKLAISGMGQSPSTRKAATSQRPARSPASVEIVNVVDAPHEPIAAQAIAALAHSYWVARGCEGGSSEEDWLRAERELREGLTVVRFSKATA